MEAISMTPFTMVSGMALMLLVLTNRFAALVSRVRDGSAGPTHKSVIKRLDVLRMSIMTATVSISLALCLTIIDTPVLEYASVVAALSSTMFFLVDIHHAAERTKMHIRDCSGSHKELFRILQESSKDAGYHFRNKVHKIRSTNMEKPTFSNIYKTLMITPVAVNESDTVPYEKSHTRAGLPFTAGLKLGYGLYGAREEGGEWEHIANFFHASVALSIVRAVLPDEDPMLPYGLTFTRAFSELRKHEKVVFKVGSEKEA